MTRGSGLRGDGRGTNAYMHRFITRGRARFSTTIVAEIEKYVKRASAAK